MNRQIKFRIRDGKNFIDPDKEIAIDLYGRVVYPGDGELLCNTDGLIISQYIGLTDKEGKEIYEGDIIEFYDAWDNKQTVVVEYNEYACFVGNSQYRYNCGFGGAIDSKNNICDCNIIGNIYENPNLLNNES